MNQDICILLPSCKVLLEAVASLPSTVPTDHEAAAMQVFSFATGAEMPPVLLSHTAKALTAAEKWCRGGEGKPGD
jgi:hypothetical protein